MEWSRIWQIEPIAFDPRMVELCDESIREMAGKSHRMPSGPLHDAAEVSRAGIPTVMMFVQSVGGISHNKMEDTRTSIWNWRSGVRPAGVESHGLLKLIRSIALAQDDDLTSLIWIVGFVFV